MVGKWDLDAAGSRRRAWAAGAAAALLLGVLLAWSPWQGQGSPQSSPTTGHPAPDTAPEMLLVHSDARLMLLGGGASHLPEIPRAGLRFSLAFSPDGAKLAFAGFRGDGIGSFAGDVMTMNVATGVTRRLLSCPERSCDVAWSPDGRSLVVASGPRLRRVDVATGAIRNLPLPAGWSVFSPDVNGDGRVVMSGFVFDAPAILAMDLTGARPSVLLGLGSGGRAVDPRWSPDGTRVAYLMLGGQEGAPQLDGPPPVSVRTVYADGSGPHTLATLPPCYCMHDRSGLDWSPEDRLSVISVQYPTRADPRSTVLLDIAEDGTVTPWGGAQQPHGTEQVPQDVEAPIAWRPALAAARR